MVMYTMSIQLDTQKFIPGIHSQPYDLGTENVVLLVPEQQVWPCFFAKMISRPSKMAMVW